MFVMETGKDRGNELNTETNMTRKEISEMLTEAGGRFARHAEHNPLVSITCVYEDEAYGSGETEVVFAVPIGWLTQKMSGIQPGHWNWGRLHGWLCNEYTSDDSRQILEDALAENMIAFCTFG